MLLYVHHSRFFAFALPSATPLASPALITNFTRSIDPRLKAALEPPGVFSPPCASQMRFDRARTTRTHVTKKPRPTCFDETRRTSPQRGVRGARGWLPPRPPPVSRPLIRSRTDGRRADCARGMRRISRARMTTKNAPRSYGTAARRKPVAYLVSCVSRSAPWPFALAHLAVEATRTRSRHARGTIPWAGARARARASPRRPPRANAPRASSRRRATS